VEPTKNDEARPWLGFAWIGWCAAMFFVVLGFGSRLFVEHVVLPDCARECYRAHAQFDHLRIGGRSGPPTACICSDSRAIETSLADVGMLVSAAGFLVACWLPWALVARRRQP